MGCSLTRRFALQKMKQYFAILGATWLACAPGTDLVIAFALSPWLQLSASYGVGIVATQLCLAGCSVYIDRTTPTPGGDPGKNTKQRKKKKKKKKNRKKRRMQTEDGDAPVDSDSDGPLDGSELLDLTVVVQHEKKRQEKREAYVGRVRRTGSEPSHDWRSQSSCCSPTSAGAGSKACFRCCRSCGVPH